MEPFGVIVSGRSGRWFGTSALDARGRRRSIRKLGARALDLPLGFDKLFGFFGEDVGGVADCWFGDGHFGA